MSKMDNLRAMREARYEKTMARAATAAPARTGAPARARSTAPASPPVSPQEAPPVQAEDGLCGHRAISGRTCTRERGHAAKSHRYA